MGSIHNQSNHLYKYDAIADVVLSPCALNINAIEDHPWWNTCPITIDMLNYRAGFTIVGAGLMTLSTFILSK